MAEPVSSHEFLRQNGATFVVFHPCGEQLLLGLGCNEQPAVIPHCIAYRRKQGRVQPLRRDQDHVQHRSASWPNQQAYETLLQVHRLLHLPSPPKPTCMQQQVQDSDQGDAFPAAKAGLVSQRDVPDGSDGFVWLDDKQQEKLQQRQQKLQQQHQGKTKGELAIQSQQVMPLLPSFAGGQVPALWPPNMYDAIWLMTPDNHIAGLDTTPHHILLDRFAAVWGWALKQLGLPQTRCRQLSAVLAVPVHMTAVEVRFLADLLLERLGFAALVVHLEPVAATFGNGTTSGCVVSIGSSSCSVCCIDDAVVLQPAHSRLTLALGLADLAGALTGWMSTYNQWPQQLQQQGLGLSTNSSTATAVCIAADTAAAVEGSEDAHKAAGTLAVTEACISSAAARKLTPVGAMCPTAVYKMLLLEDLVLQQCYLPKENLQPGLLGQPMLEVQQPAVVPVRAPGKPTTNYSVSLGSWAAAAAMALFVPDLAPALCGPDVQQSPEHMAGIQAATDTPAGTSVKQEPGENGPATSLAAGVSAASTEGLVAPGWRYKKYHDCTVELPAAEALHLQSQIKARLETGETGPPPDGMYLLQLELTEQPVNAANPAAAAAGAGAGAAGGVMPSSKLGAEDGCSEVGPAADGAGSNKASPSAAAAAGGGGGATTSARTSQPGGVTTACMGIDEAVFRSIMATSSGRPELMSRLAAGLLLIGPGGALRGLASMLERRVANRFNAARQPQVVSTLEPRAEPAHVAWKGAALLAALDAGRENWLPRHQWVQGGMAIPAPTAAKGVSTAAMGVGAGSGGAAAAGSSSTAAAGRHAKLFYYCRAEQGLL